MATDKSNTFGTWIGVHFGHNYYGLNVMLICFCSIFFVVLVALLIKSAAQLSYYNQQLSEYYKTQKSNELNSNHNLNTDRPKSKRYIIPIPKIHIPYIAWIMAFLIFDIYWIISFSLGTVHEMYYLISIYDVTNGYSDNITFIAWTVLNCLMELILYGVLWRKWTITYDRKIHLIICLSFGIIWGLSQSQILISFYRILRAIKDINDKKWLLWIATFISWSIFQPIFDEFIWNKYVMPTHDNKWSLVIKPFVIHIPNTIVTLSYLVHYDNIIFFTLFQTIALTLVVIGLKFPPFWSPTTKQTESLLNNNQSSHNNR